MVRLLKALALVAILSITSLFPIWDAPESGLVQGATLGTFSNGNQSVNITFDGPGEDTSVSVRLPARVNVTTAALQVKGSAVEKDGFVKNSTVEEFRAGTSENLIIDADGVRLETTNLTWVVTDDDGFKAGTITNVNITDGSISNDMTGFIKDVRVDPNGKALDQQISCVAVAQNGTLFISWGESRGGPWFAPPDQVYIAQSNDHGHTFINETLVYKSSKTVTDEEMTLDESGNIHMVYSIAVGIGSEPQAIQYNRSTDGGNSFETSVLIGNGTAPSIAAGAGGRIYIAWQNYTTTNTNKIMVASSSDGGVSWGAPVRVDTGNGNATKPSIKVDGMGKVHVAWYDGRSGTGYVYYANSTDNGVTYSQDKPARTDLTGSVPRLAVQGNVVHIAYMEPTATPNLRYMRSSDSGSSFSAPLSVWSGTSTASVPAIVIGPTGTVHLAWNTNTVIHHTSSVDGVSFATLKRVDNATGGTRYDVAISVDKRDNVYVTWTDTRNAFTDVWFSRYPSVGMVESVPYDLKTVPMAYLGFSINATVPLGSEVQAKLHTSANGQDWSPWETMEWPDQTISLQPERYVQWMIFMWANSSAAPTIFDVNLVYRVGQLNGTLISEPTITGTLYSARVYWNGTMNGQDFDIEISPDNGTTWRLAGQVGGLITFAGIGGTMLMYRVKFLSTVQGESAVFKDITINYLTSELPTDLEIIMTGAGDPDWTFFGPFEGMEMVSGFGEKLTSYLANATPDSEDQVTVPVKVSCKSPGKLEFRNLNLKYSAPPDAPALMEPVNGSVVSTSTPTFSMNGSEPDGDDMMFRIEVFGPTQQNPVAVFDQTVNAMNGKWNTGYFSPGEKATFTPSGDFALPDGNLTWRALAYDAMFWSKPSQPWTLVVDTHAPWGSVTDDGAETDSHQELHASFIFTDNTSGITGYEYCIGTSQGGNDTHPITATDEAGVTMTGLELSPGGTYYFTARAKDRAGLWSPWASSDGIMVSGQGPTVGLSYQNGVQAETLIDLNTDLKDPMGGRVDDVDMEWSWAPYANGTMGDWAPWADVGDASGGDSKVTGHSGTVGNVYRFRARGHNDRGIWGLFETPASTIRIDRAPMLDAGPDQHAKSGDMLYFNASAVDEDGDALNFTWYFPDDESTQSGANVSHVFSKGGDWEVEVTVTDGTTNATRTVLVKVEGKKSNTGKVPGLTVPLMAAAIAVAAIIVASARSRRS